jgi:two-component system NtrC family sensor kinase
MQPNPRIMIVEDSETQAVRLQLFLEAEGWDVCRARSAESALEEVNRCTPDLVVADYYLPGILGDEFCRLIRTNLNTRLIPILMLTADEANFAETRALESGADDYVSKSESSDFLVLRIRALLRKAPSQGVLVNRQRHSDFRGARLLAIDDSPTHLEHVTEELRSEGYQVEKATNGPEALDRIAHNTFDCILVDLVMPGMDGIQVCRRITEIRRTQESAVAVIMLTSRETAENMTQALEAGADDFVGKSSDLSVLKARIQALLRRKFFQEENRRMVEELKSKELETIRAHVGKAAAEARAAMAGELTRANLELEEANHKLKNTQMHLIQTEKMSSLGQLVAGIAHEINNPLAFVLNNLFTVQDGLERLAPEVVPNLSETSLVKFQKVRARVGDMKQGLDRVKELVLNLRTFSRLDEGEFKTIDLHQSIDSALLFLQHKMKGRIELEKRYGSVETLSCYAGRLNQVFLNLLANAVDAIEGEGKITISTSQTDKTVVISVRDTGKGISEPIRNRIFEPFFTTKAVGEGTGLGLAISYGIIQAHHGAIDVVSEEGKGAEFTIRIPLDLKAPTK